MAETYTLQRGYLGAAGGELERQRTTIQRSLTLTQILILTLTLGELDQQRTSIQRAKRWCSANPRCAGFSTPTDAKLLSSDGLMAITYWASTSRHLPMCMNPCISCCSLLDGHHLLGEHIPPSPSAIPMGMHLTITYSTGRAPS